MPLQISKGVALPCGITLENRLVKVCTISWLDLSTVLIHTLEAAMAEGMADSDHMPHENSIKAYSQWADGGWGLIITGTTSTLLIKLFIPQSDMPSGNVQVDVKYLGEMRDTAVSDVAGGRAKTMTAWKKWSAACQKNGTPTIVQLNHPGRQSPIFAGSKSLFEKNIAPSAIPLDFGPSLISRGIRSLVFGSPREMTADDINRVIDQFGNSAQLAADSGFKGVEIHAAHGYLLGEF
jgi:2,4-dienoyl-CoA reductase-like NADH-dependent reductase (Old Yellow Enzyme family)